MWESASCSQGNIHVHLICGPRGVFSEPYMDSSGINGIINRGSGVSRFTLYSLQAGKMSALKYTLSLMALLVVSVWAEVSTQTIPVQIHVIWLELLALWNVCTKTYCMCVAIFHQPMFAYWLEFIPGFKSVSWDKLKMTFYHLNYACSI